MLGSTMTAEPKIRAAYRPGSSRPAYGCRQKPTHSIGTSAGSSGTQRLAGRDTERACTASTGASRTGPYGPPAAKNAATATTTAAKASRGYSRRASSPATITTTAPNSQPEIAVGETGDDGPAVGGTGEDGARPSGGAWRHAPGPWSGCVTTIRALASDAAPTATANGASTRSTFPGRAAVMIRAYVSAALGASGDRRTGLRTET